MKKYRQIIGASVVEYFYDKSIRAWTIYPLDLFGNQATVPDYFGNRESLLASYPTLKFETK